MNSILTFLALVLAAGIILLVPTLVTPHAEIYGQVTIVDCARAVLPCCALAGVAGWLTYRSGSHGPFLLKLFILGLLLRVIIATIIFIFNLQDFFGGDTLTYDSNGLFQLEAWGGNQYLQSRVDLFIGKGIGSGWGMVYLVAGVYGIVGRNMLAVQFLNAVIGAVTAPIIFLCALQVYGNTKVARLAACVVAFYPSLVLWSSQGLKDAPIVFLLAFSILATLKLGEKFRTMYLVALVTSLFCLLSLRFYVFYMLLVAIGGAFLIGMQEVSARSFGRQFVIIIV